MSASTQTTTDSTDAQNDDTDSFRSRASAMAILAAEMADVVHTFKDGDKERSPRKGTLPTGENAGRVLIAGTATETRDVGNSEAYWELRVVDNSGTAFVYAGQYQPDAASTIQNLDAPQHVVVIGKPRTFTSEDDDGNEETVAYVQPESISVVDAEERERQSFEAAAATIERLGNLANGDAAAAELADDVYGADRDLEQYREAAEDVLDSFDGE